MTRRLPLVVAGLVAAAFITAVPRLAAADVGQCVDVDSQGYCVEWDVPSTGDGGGFLGDRVAAVTCYWVSFEGDLSDDPTTWYDYDLDPPPEGVEVVWQVKECSDGSTMPNFRWIVPVTPANLAAVARGRLAGQLPVPVIESSPPAGTASIVGVPVFVRVGNWAGVVSESECAGGVCVTVTASPVVQFAPGEPGSEPVACTGAGLRYVPGAGSADAQSSLPGACAYAYRLRTGAEGRPSVWPGVVSVMWTVAWTASSGASGSLPSVTRSAALPRAVSEVQTVVAGGITP